MTFKFIAVPKEFECSITNEIMIDPVFTTDGETYEKHAIEDWLQAHDTSPNTNEKLAHKTLTPNRLLKSQIKAFVETNKKNFELELMHAAEQNDVQTVNLLLKLGININSVNEHGLTPLHLSISKSYKELFDLLMINNANMELASANMMLTATSEALPQLSPFHLAVLHKNMDMLKAMFAKKVNINIKDGTGRTALHWACYLGSTIITQFLLTNHADFNAQDEAGDTPLHLAAQKQNNAIMELLLKKDANHRLCNKLNQTPVHLENSPFSFIKTKRRELKQLKIRNMEKTIEEQSKKILELEQAVKKLILQPPGVVDYQKFILMGQFSQPIAPTAPTDIVNLKK